MKSATAQIYELTSFVSVTECEITDSTPASLIVDDIYKLYVVRNVEAYESTGLTTHRLTFRPVEKVGAHYFVIDLMEHDAFGHWVYESAVYLPLFKKLKTFFPTLRLLLKGSKTFKTLFLQYFKIPMTEVCYNLEPGNVCVFPSPITAMRDLSCTDAYMKIVDGFMLEFQGESTHRYDYVVLPRQKLENYAPNNRSYDMTTIMTTLTGANYLVYNTDTDHSLEEQIAVVRSAPTVIVTDGSPFLVNLMFGQNQHFLVVDNLSQSLSVTFPKLRYIIDTACRNGNRVEFLDKKIYKW